MPFIPRHEQVRHPLSRQLTACLEKTLLEPDSFEVTIDYRGMKPLNLLMLLEHMRNRPNIFSIEIPIFWISFVSIRASAKPTQELRMIENVDGLKVAPTSRAIQSLLPPYDVEKLIEKLAFVSHVQQVFDEVVWS
ncbi:hypothetical protein SDJN03_27769, partial [Cucurbita argyrosperma subsp. sororia]